MISDRIIIYIVLFVYQNYLRLPVILTMAGTVLRAVVTLDSTGVTQPTLGQDKHVTLDSIGVTQPTLGQDKHVTLDSTGVTQPTLGHDK